MLCERCRAISSRSTPQPEQWWCTGATHTVLTHGIPTAIDRSAAAELLFEHAAQQKVTMALQTTCSCMASGRTDAIVLDVGYGLLQADALIEGMHVQNFFKGGTKYSESGVRDLACFGGCATAVHGCSAVPPLDIDC